MPLEPWSVPIFQPALGQNVSSARLPLRGSCKVFVSPSNQLTGKEKIVVAICRVLHYLYWCICLFLMVNINY